MWTTLDAVRAPEEIVFSLKSVHISHLIKLRQMQEKEVIPKHAAAVSYGIQIVLSQPLSLRDLIFLKFGGYYKP